MTGESGSLDEPGMLTPSIPWDIAARSQRERILGALTKSCAEKTFAATTIADIVSNASISRATFYKHFTNKTECFLAATDSFVEELREVAVAARASADSAGAGELRTVIAAVLERLAARPEHAKLLLIEAPHVDLQIVRGYRRRVLDALEAELRDAGDGNRAGADPEIAFGRAKVLVAERIVAGDIERLSELLPELVYIALLPYVGQDTALEQAQSIQ
jgi:AcrR family transcriptional regulator